MNIQKIYGFNYAQKTNFKSAISKDNKEQTTTLGCKLPDSKQYEYAPLYTNPKKGSELQAQYKEKLRNICFDEKGNLHPAIKKKLDESCYIFEQPDGSSKLMTIKDALKSYVGNAKPIDTRLLHGTFVQEDADSIIKNGFDPKRINNTYFGPGFYFTPSEGDALIYGSAKVEARIKGNCAHANGKFYEKINNWPVQESVKKFIGLNSYGYPTQDIENGIANSIINEYVRNVLFNEMGYDCAYGANRGSSCIVVFNPDSISDIRPY